MIDVSTDLRIAYLDKLNTVQVDGVPIPAFDEEVNPNATIPTVRGASCYVLILDQSEVEINGTMCGDRENAMITLKVVAKYPKGSGGKRVAEDISSAIQQAVRSNSFTHLLNTSLNIQKVRKVLAQSITENGTDFTAYTKNIIYQNVIKL